MNNGDMVALLVVGELVDDKPVPVKHLERSLK